MKSDWTLASNLVVGAHVRLRTNGSTYFGDRLAGVVRQIEGDDIFVEPDFPDVDENGEFDMWKCTKGQLLVRRSPAK
jgi:hypothetical protein